MILLLDTHALLWWATGNVRLSSRAKRAIGREDAEVYVSAATAWEIDRRMELLHVGDLDDEWQGSGDDG